MIIIAILWTSICFFYGTILLIKNLFNKNFTILQAQPIKLKIYILILGTVVFFYVPFLFQKICAHFLPQQLPQVDKILQLAFYGELCLAISLGIVLYRYKFLQQYLQLNTPCTKETFIQIFNGFCQCLPLLLTTTFLWQIILSIFIKIGIPLSIDQQPIIQLLERNQSHIYSIVGLSLCVTIFAPLCEEIIFRGILLKFLINFFSINKALCLNGFIFAIAHQHFATLLPLTVLGYWLGLIYIKTSNIWVNIGIHSLFNGTNLALILLFK